MATEGFIKYRSGYKYQLDEDHAIGISIKPTSDITKQFIVLDTGGNLMVKKGYAWDGPSGPVRDTDGNLRASLVHDALYQLMRNEDLSREPHRKAADQAFRDICKADGVSRIRAFLYYKALRKFGKKAASPENKRQVKSAPRE